MRKIIILFLFGFFIFGVFGVLAYSGSDWFYHTYDKVSGGNLELVEFSDEFDIIDILIYNDQIKSNRNSFNAKVILAESDDLDLFEVDDFRFSGTTYFSDQSKVQYSLEDLEVEWTNVEEDNYAEFGGVAVLKYRAVLVIEKEIPVDVYADFYKDLDDISYQDNNLEFVGIYEDLFVTFEGGNVRHQNYCFLGC